jgi:hypothetical protein
MSFLPNLFKNTAFIIQMEHYVIGDCIGKGNYGDVS